MTLYRDCFACQRAGTQPKAVPKTDSRIVYDPGIAMPGQPTLEGHRLAALQLTTRAWLYGWKDVAEDFELRRDQVLLAMWWAGRFGPRKWQKLLGEWALVADAHLWHGCSTIPDPPTKQSTATEPKEEDHATT